MDEEKFVESELEKEIVVISKTTIDRLLKEPYPADLISLYTFYTYTAKWQKTTRPRATDHYVKNGLRWGIDKVRRSQKKLVELKLIEKVNTRDETGKITGWYIRVNYLFPKKSAGRVQNTQNPQVEKPTSGFQDTNALRTNNINALELVGNKDVEHNSLPSNFQPLPLPPKPEPATKGRTGGLTTIRDTLADLLGEREAPNRSFACPLPNKKFKKTHAAMVKAVFNTTSVGEKTLNAYLNCAFIGCVTIRRRWNYRGCEEKNFETCKKFIDHNLQSLKDALDRNLVRKSNWPPAYLAGIVEKEINEYGEEWFKNGLPAEHKI